MRAPGWLRSPAARHAAAGMAGTAVVMAALAYGLWHPNSGLRFANPWFLLGWLAIPVLIWRAATEPKRAGKMRHPMTALAAALRPGWRVRLLPVQTGVRCAALALIAIALARPQDTRRTADMDVEGIDIVLVLDLSASMGARDLVPSRAEAAKAVVRDFIARRKNDRIGAVVFAEKAYTLCPLTLDYAVLSQMIAELELGVIEDQRTAIGNAVSVALNRLRHSTAKTKTIILLTDGASNAGNVSPQEATRFAQTLGVRVYPVFLGQNQNRAEINPELLRDMAKKTGGAFFVATDTDALRSSFHRILDALEKSRIEDRGVAYAEVFPSYLWPALILALLDLLATVFVLRRTP